MHAPNPKFKKKNLISPYLFRSRVIFIFTEPAGSGKKTGSVRNRSGAVWRGGSDRWGLRTGWTGRFYRFRFGSCNKPSFLLFLEEVLDQKHRERNHCGLSINCLLPSFSGTHHCCIYRRYIGNIAEILWGLIFS
jgi:hypothetical protein